MAHNSPTVWGYTLGERVWLKVAVSPAGTAANRFIIDTGADLTIQPNSLVALRYDSTQSKRCSVFRLTL